MAAAAGVLYHTVSSPLLNRAWPDSGVDARDGVSTTSNGALARLAVPDTGSVSSDGGLAAEGAGVLGVLGDFHLLHLLTQGGTVSVEGWSIFGSFVSLLVRFFMVVRGRV